MGIDLEAALGMEQSTCDVYRRVPRVQWLFKGLSSEYIGLAFVYAGHLIKCVLQSIRIEASDTAKFCDGVRPFDGS
jgi:hypothetical protein